MSNEWRFHHNGYGQGVGLNEGGTETFKGNPDGSLAREICQNSIDAGVEGETVFVEFKIFNIERTEIFGIEKLTNEIKNCYSFRKGKQPEDMQLRSMLECINKEEITCLRISDFQTKGLIGVSTDQIDEPFYNLTKGSGTSAKEGSSGGSKGIGKFAAFGVSLTNTVFYSTRTIEGEKGGIGISKLRSAPYMGDRKLLTQGIGYYGADETNAPIQEDFSLDSNFKRNEDDYGTDLFIIGYNNRDHWKEIITCEILDSFMIAILENKLNVVVDDIEINRETIPEIIYKTKVLDVVKLKLRKSIKSQYELYTGCDDPCISIKEFHIEQGAFKAYVKQYNSKNEKEASKQCIMIRYPYMKIRYTRGHSFLPYSSMIVIGDNEINHLLRAIENPQHTEWQIDRLNNYPDDKKKTSNMLDEINKQFREYIQEVLNSSVGEQTDVEGAGDFLPSVAEGLGENKDMIFEGFDVSPVKKVKLNQARTEKIGNKAESSVLDKGETETEIDGENKTLEGIKNRVNPEQDSSVIFKDGGQGKNDGNKPLQSKVLLSGMRYRNIATDGDLGKYDVIFISEHNEKLCELEIKQIGEAGDSYKIDIVKAKINDCECTVEGGIIKNFEITKGNKYKISYEVELHELFASEVKLSAYR